MKSGVYNPLTGKAVKWTDIATVSVEEGKKVSTNYYDISGINKLELQT